MLINLFKKYDERPRIKIEATVLDKILDGCSLVFLLLMLAMVFQNYADLPSQIPTHFGDKGNVDDYGKKQSILILPVLGIALFVGLIFLYKIPHKFNYIVKITPKNAEQQYRLATRMMRFVNLFVMLIFYFIVYKIINSANNKTTPVMDKWFTPMVLAIAMIGGLSVFALSLLKNKKSK
ncbi:MAG: DUF1648 domain-containing protein [Zetaproteobacteria bacterium]|nr:DUF1648 domain-containing protein [Zetaproteobacteria bacterium]PJA05146.1 MAG: hypothetical protein COX71_08090 [Flavobacteriales bacterium CG_4_10_14_0_2_um_filter_35_18]